MMTTIFSKSSIQSSSTKIPILSSFSFFPMTKNRKIQKMEVAVGTVVWYRIPESRKFRKPSATRRGTLSSSGAVRNNELSSQSSLRKGEEGATQLILSTELSTVWRGTWNLGLVISSNSDELNSDESTNILDSIKYVVTPLAPLGEHISQLSLKVQHAMGNVSHAEFKHTVTSSMDIIVANINGMETVYMIGCKYHVCFNKITFKCAC
jgi:hypothetical protein